MAALGNANHEDQAGLDTSVLFPTGPRHRRSRSGLATRALLVLLTILGAVTLTASPAEAAVYAAYRVTTDVSARSTPTAAPTGVYGIPNGSAFGVQCQVIGEPVGPRGNTLYFWALYAGRSFYIPDTYTDSPHLAGQPPIAGIPMCGAAPAPPPPSPTAGSVAWVGSPISSTVSSSPSDHHRPYGGQWSVDLASGSSQPVRVFAAVDPQRDPRLSARILQVNYACAQIPWDSAAGASHTAARRLSRGGKVVKVGIYFDGAQIGTVQYAHLDTTTAIGSYNTPIARWGGEIGMVGTYQTIYKADGTYCWKGQHVHVEAGNVAGQSCYWSGLTTLGRSRGPGDYLGYVGYNSPSRVCPSGI